MKYPLYRYFLAILGALAVLTILLPLVLFILAITYIVAIPSRIGARAPIESWIHQGMDAVLDLQLMRQFRDDIFHRIRPHIEFTEELERWWVLREMELSIERTNTALQSGEYAIAVSLAVGSIVLDTPVLGISVGVLLTLLAIGLSALIIVRIVAIKILAFRPEAHLEEPTHELAVRMAFNRGPLAQGSSIAIALLTLFIGISRGAGYNTGLEIIEWIAARSHPDNGERWRVQE